MRKSKSLRLQQTLELARLYEEKGYTSNRTSNFVLEMLGRLRIGKSLSKRQREWLDELISKGVDIIPVVSEDVQNKIQEINSLVPYQYPKEVAILEDFKSKLSLGKELSERQNKFLEDLLSQARVIKENGFWEPDSKTFEHLKICSQLISYKNRTWLSYKSSLYDSSRVIIKFLYDKESGINSKLNKRDADILLDYFKKELESYDNPEYHIGECVQISGEAAIILESPFFLQQDLCYSVLINGSKTIANVKEIKKL